MVCTMTSMHDEDGGSKRVHGSTERKHSPGSVVDALSRVLSTRPDNKARPLARLFQALLIKSREGRGAKK